MVLPNHQTVEDSPEAGTLDGVISCECGRDGHGALDRDAGMFGECQQCEDAAIHIYGLPPDIRLAELKYCFHKMGDITDIQSSGDGHALVVTIPWLTFTCLSAAQASVAKYHEGSFDGRKIGVELRLAAANTPALNYVPRGESPGRYRKSKKAHRPHQAPPLSGANKLPLGYGSGSLLSRPVRSRSGPSNKKRPRHTSSIAAYLAQIPLLSWDWFDKRTPRGLTKCDPTRSSPILVRKYWLRHLAGRGDRHRPFEICVHKTTPGLPRSLLLFFGEQFGTAKIYSKQFFLLLQLLWTQLSLCTVDSDPAFPPQPLSLTTLESSRSESCPLHPNNSRRLLVPASSHFAVEGVKFRLPSAPLSSPN
ncbi:hypothetical protein B0H13DRAFT_1923716 [Mycena leptocephala]|nr:hypothetical protein B0H13DRAFT_1923716 [Mycena leptocephala]